MAGTQSAVNYHQMATEFISGRYLREGERTLQFDGSTWWEWRQPVYVPVSVAAVEDKLLMWLASKGYSSTRVRDEVYAHLRAVVREGTNGQLPKWTPAKDSAEASSSWMAFQNGVLNMSAMMATGQTQLRPVSPRWFDCKYTPYAFDPQAQCPVFRQCLQEWVAGESERQLLQEFAGYILHTEDCRFHKALFLSGEGNNGKSTFLDAIRGAVGEENAWALELTSFGQKYALAPMYGKLVNISPEAKSSAKLDTNLLKQFISGDPMSYEDKWQPFVSKPNKTKLIVAWNRPPKIDDSSDGFWRRVLLVTFPRSFAGQEDVDLTAKLRQERAGIMNWMIAGRRRLFEQGRFTECPSVVAAVKALRQAEAPIVTWLRDHLQAADQSQYVVKTDLFTKYQQYAEDEGHEQPSDVKLGKAVLEAFPHRTAARVGAGRQPVYKGMTWKPQACSPEATEIHVGSAG